MKSRTGVAEKHLPDDNKMGNTVTGLEIKSVTAYEVSNSIRAKVSTQLYDGYSIHFYQAYKKSAEQKMGTVGFAYAWGDTPDVYFELDTLPGSWTDDMVYIGISTGAFQHTEIEKIWFE